jgi:outer membrane protein assembly factor BamB/class 3 adenylate cyclase
MATSATGTQRDRAPENRTFLIADIRGYTQYTVERGDDEAAALAGRFADLAKQAVEAHEGDLLELRGDEALAVFVSARQALRAAVALQRLIGTSGLSRPVGIGLDTGEAVQVGAGYRGTALNLAARLCAQAGPGQIVATDTVVHLAARIEGVGYTNPRTLRLKGFEAPVRVLDIVAEDSGLAPRRPRSRIAIRSDRRVPAVAVAVLVVAALGAGAWVITRSGAGTGPGNSATPGGASPSAATSGTTQAPNQAADVAMFKGSLSRTNLMPGPAPEGRLSVRWHFDAAADIGTQPIVGGGKVIAGGRDGIVHVVDLTTGLEDWSYAAGSPIMASAAVADGTLYVTSNDGIFHAVDMATHQERWRVTGASPGAEPTVILETAYVGMAAGRFAAVSTADGHELWHVDVSGDASKNAIESGVAFVDGEGSDALYAIDLATGTIRWQTKIGTTRVITPAVAGGTVYVVGIDVAGGDSHLAAIDAATGVLRWRFAAPTHLSLSTLAVGVNRVFTNTDNPTGTTLYAVDRQSGGLSWSVPIADGPISHPAIVGNRLFVASGTGVIHELDAMNGTEIGSVPIGGPAVAGPTVTGGVVLVGTGAGTSTPGGIWAVGSEPGATASPEPIPVKWLADLKAPDDKSTLYLNVAVDGADNVYATDRLSDRIVIWDPAGKPTVWGKQGSGPGEFDFSEVTLGDQSMSVAIAADGRIAVGDGGNHRVQIFDAKRRFLRSIGRQGTGVGQFVNPCCVAFDAQGLLYVADDGRNDIQVFARDGTLVRAIGSAGGGNGQFVRPAVPFIDPATGNIWIPDFGNRRIEVMAADGTFLASYGDGQNGNPQLSELNGVVLDTAGRMFAVDTDNLLWVLDPTGNTLWRLGPEHPGAGYVAPPFLWLTADGRVYLPDSAPGSNRVVVLQLEAPLWPPP